jgi:hypothetical protein
MKIRFSSLDYNHLIIFKNFTIDTFILIEKDLTDIQNGDKLILIIKMDKLDNLKF